MFLQKLQIILSLYLLKLFFSFLRNRFLIITATIFSTIFIFAGAILSIGHIIYLKNITEDNGDIIAYFGTTTNIRLMLVIIITYICCNFYFGKNCLNNGGGGSHSVHFGHSYSSKNKSSRFHNKSKPYKIGIHKKSKPKKKSTFAKKTHSSHPHHGGRGGRRGGRQ